MLAGAAPIWVLTGGVMPGGFFQAFEFVVV
jgi:hypothetical protein